MEKNLDWKCTKYAARCLETILKATPHKTAAVRPLASHLTNHQVRHGLASVGRLANIYSVQTQDAVIEELPGLMAVRDGWCE